MTTTETSITKLIILLVFLQYILLGYNNYYSSFIEIFLLIILFFICNFKYQFKIIGLLITLIIIYYYNNNELSKEFFVSYKNILIFLLVYFYFLKEGSYLFGPTESVLLSLMLAFPIIGFFIPEFNINLHKFSNHSYANNIFSNANLGLNFHFSTQIILAYFIIFYCYYHKFNTIGNFKFFFSNSKIILLTVIVITFYLLINSSGTTTGIWAFIITIFSTLVFNIIKNNKLINLGLLIYIYPLVLLLCIYLIIDSKIINDLVYIITDKIFFGSISFQIISYELYSIDYFLSHSTWLPTFVVDLDPYSRYIYNTSEISLIRHIFEYGIFLFIFIIIFINRKFSPVALFFTIALIHYSYLFTGISAFLIVKMHNAMYLNK
jgi:hypothetical protein